jgi:hypothetical protein
MTDSGICKLAQDEHRALPARQHFDRPESSQTFMLAITVEHAQRGRPRVRV